MDSPSLLRMKKMNEKPGHDRPASEFNDNLNAHSIVLFVLHKNLSGDQVYWLSANEITSQASKPATPATPFVHNRPPPSQVLANLQKVNAVPLEDSCDQQLKEPEVTGKTSSGPSTSETPKVLAPGMYNLGSKYIPPPKRANWVKTNLLPKKKQCLSQQSKPTSGASKTVPKRAPLLSHSFFAAKSANTKRHTRQPNRVLETISKNVATTKPQWKPTGRHFSLYEMYPLTRIMEPTDKPIELPPSASSSPKITMISRFTDHKLSDRKAGKFKLFYGTGFWMLQDILTVNDLFQWFDDDEVIPPPAVPIPPVNAHAAQAPENAIGSPSTTVISEGAPAVTESPSPTQLLYRRHSVILMIQLCSPDSRQTYSTGTNKGLQFAQNPRVVSFVNQIPNMLEEILKIYWYYLNTCTPLTLQWRKLPDHDEDKGAKLSVILHDFVLSPTKCTYFYKADLFYNLKGTIHMGPVEKYLCSSSISRTSWLDRLGLPKSKKSTASSTTGTDSSVAARFYYRKIEMRHNLFLCVKSHGALDLGSSRCFDVESMKEKRVYNRGELIGHATEVTCFQIALLVENIVECGYWYVIEYTSLVTTAKGTIIMLSSTIVNDDTHYHGFVNTAANGIDVYATCVWFLVKRRISRHQHVFIDKETAVEILVLLNLRGRISTIGYEVSTASFILRLDLGWNRILNVIWLVLDLLFELVTEIIDYHLFEVEVEFHRIMAGRPRRNISNNTNPPNETTDEVTRQLNTALPNLITQLLLMEEYCPDDEVQKLESEFWNHKMVGSDIDGYTARFHELAKLVPHMVTPESQRVNRYIRGLAPEIKPHVTSSKPATIQGDVSMANRLTTNGIKDGLFKKKENAGNKRRSNDQNRNQGRDDRNKR
ncbi:hypothetical protein Tco_0013974 [Tanacetum coccineum]